jgi:hypothetical protein
MLELAPYPTMVAGQVVKASPGHFPLPFWISVVKRTGAKIKAPQNATPKIYVKRIKNRFRCYQ